MFTFCCFGRQATDKELTKFGLLALRQRSFGVYLHARIPKASFRVRIKRENEVWLSTRRDLSRLDLSAVKDVVFLADAGCCFLIFQRQESESSRPVGILVPHDNLTYKT
jgi:hypothetical protein